MLRFTELWANVLKAQGAEWKHFMYGDRSNAKAWREANEKAWEEIWAARAEFTAYAKEIDDSLPEEPNFYFNLDGVYMDDPNDEERRVRYFPEY